MIKVHAVRLQGKERSRGFQEGMGYAALASGGGVKGEY